MARREVLVQDFLGGGEAVVEVEILNLDGDAALDVLEGEVAGCWVAGFDDVEEVGVCVGGEEGVGGGLLPVG